MAKSPDTAGKRTQLSVFLSDYRRQQNLTQKQLQEKLGHGTPGYISKIEIGLIGTPEAGAPDAYDQTLVSESTPAR